MPSAMKKALRSPVLRWEPAFTRQLFRLAVPIALQSVVTASMQLVDNLMIGVLGDVPLAGVTQANRISFLFQVAMFGAISGASIFVAQYWGRRDVAGVRRTQGIAMAFGLLVAAALGIPSILMPESIMRLLISSEEGVRAGAEYLGIIGVVYFVQSQSLIQAAVLKSTEQVKLPMFASIAAICTNVVFNTLLIYPTRDVQLLGLAFTMPGAGMGVRGGAYATLVGACVELFLILFFSYRWHFANAARARELLPGSSRAVRNFIAIALPVLLNEAVWASGLGSCLADLLTGFTQWVIPTFFIKVIIALIACRLLFDKNGSFRLFHWRSFLAAGVSMAWMAAGYTVMGSVLYGSLAAGLASSPGLIIEGIVNIAVYFAAAAVLEKAHVRRLLRTT